MRHLFTRKHFSPVYANFVNKQHCFITKLFKPLIDYAASGKLFFSREKQTLENLANSNCERSRCNKFWMFAVCWSGGSSKITSPGAAMAQSFSALANKLKIHKSNSTKAAAARRRNSARSERMRSFLRYLTVNKFHEVILFSCFVKW